MIRVVTGVACAALLAASAASAACARAGAGDPALAVIDNCSGKLFLEVHNPLPIAIDVYEGDKMKRSDARHIGNAPPGDTRLPVTHRITRLFSIDANGQGLTWEPSASTIRFRTLCIT